MRGYFLTRLFFRLADKHGYVKAALIIAAWHVAIFVVGFLVLGGLLYCVPVVPPH